MSDPDFVTRIETDFQSLEDDITSYGASAGITGRYAKAIKIASAAALAVAAMSYYNRDDGIVTKAALALATSAAGSLVSDSMCDPTDPTCQSQGYIMFVAPAVGAGLFYLASARMPEIDANNLDAVLIAAVIGTLQN